MPGSRPASRSRPVPREGSAEPAMHEWKEIQSQETDREQRLDRFLAAQLPDLSRARLQELIRAGSVLRDGVALTRPAEKLQGGEVLQVRLDPRPALALQAQELPLDILYEDDDLVVLNKPAGMVVHPGAGCREGTLANALLHHFETLSRRGGDDRPGIVHRLDRFTSGVLAVARSDAAHQALAAQFQARTVEKTYWALVHGAVRKDHGEIDAPIERDRVRRTRMTTKRQGGRKALTEYRVQERFTTQVPQRGSSTLRSIAYTWLNVRIHTGRTHQIRVHLASIGHPVAGDPLYGAPATLPGPGSLTGLKLPRVFLHAGQLCLDHPRTGERLCFDAPLPAELQEWLGILRKQSQVTVPTASTRPAGR